MIDTTTARIECAYCGETVPLADAEAAFWQAQGLPVLAAMEIHEHIPVSREGAERPRVVFNEPSDILFPPPTCSACWKRGSSG